MPRSRVRHSHGPDPAALAARIRAERMRLGLSQAEAARRIGVHRDTYRQWEEGRDLPLSSLCALVALGMRLGRIVPELTALDALAGKNQ